MTQSYEEKKVEHRQTVGFKPHQSSFPHHKKSKTKENLRVNKPHLCRALVSLNAPVFITPCVRNRLKCRRAAGACNAVLPLTGKPVLIRSLRKGHNDGRNTLLGFSGSGISLGQNANTGHNASDSPNVLSTICPYKYLNDKYELKKIKNHFCLIQDRQLISYNN